MTLEYDKCLKKGKIKPFSRGKTIAEVEGLQEAKNLREDADYYGRWSQTGCEKLLKIAKEFISQAEIIIR